LSGVRLPLGVAMDAIPRAVPWAIFVSSPSLRATVPP
jgi:hypothetical protein